MKRQRIDIPDWDLDKPAVIRAWKDVSGLYANQASGEVRAVVGTSLREGNVWETVELPRLIANPKVTRIVQIDPESGLETILLSR